MMNEQVMTSFIEWAERVEKLTQENSLINSRDILHDVFGMLRDDEHFLPPVSYTHLTLPTIYSV